jgi:quinol-cytochrome oxidoreductase complex cytochrome b subunit
MNYSNVIGFLTLIVSPLQFPSGPSSSRHHSPFIAPSPVYHIMIDVSVGRFIRSFHVLGAPLFMVFILFH